MGENKKIYIEFFGLSGSGKSALCNRLADKMRKSGRDAVSQQKEFLLNPKIYRHVVPVLHTILKLRFDVFKFLLYVQRNFKKHNRGIRKYFFITQWFLNSHFKNHILLSDEGLVENIVLLDEEVLTSKINLEKTIKILKFYPKNMDIFLVFVDISPQIAYKRLTTLRRKNCKPLDGEELERKKLLYNRNKEMFNLLKEQEGKLNIKKIIKIDGERPIDENVSFLHKQFSKFINK